MDTLPDLPFEKVLSYLTLYDLLSSRAVSKKWRKTIDHFKVKTLCYSGRQSESERKNRLDSVALTKNIIRSGRFETFFERFSNTIFSNLKHLRICDLKLCVKNALAETLHSFRKLEELEIIGLKLDDDLQLVRFKFELPAVKKIHFEGLPDFTVLTLNAPNLKEVKFDVTNSLPRLNIVHGQTIEKLVTLDMKQISSKNLMNLKYLCCKHLQVDQPAILSGLKSLKEIHVTEMYPVWKLFEQKNQYKRFDLKIFYHGVLLDRKDDPIMWRFSEFHQDTFVFLTKNPSRLAYEIPFCEQLSYSATPKSSPELEINVLKRLTGLRKIFIHEQVPDIQRFLNLLENLNTCYHIKLFFFCEQPQQLIKQLPDHVTLCTVSRKRKFSSFAEMTKNRRTSSVDSF